MISYTAKGITDPAGKKALWISSGIPCYAQIQLIIKNQYKCAFGLLGLSNWAVAFNETVIFFPH